MADMAGLPFSEMWADLQPLSTNIDDRRHTSLAAKRAQGVTLYRRPPLGPVEPHLPEPTGSMRDALGTNDINNNSGRRADPADAITNSMGPQSMFGLPPLGPALGAGAKLASPFNPLGILYNGVQLAGRDTPEMLASKRERASKMRGAYNDFFDTPGQKAAMADKNVTPLTPGDSYYNNTLNFTDPNKPFVGPAPKSGNPWWLDLAKQFGGVPDKPAPPPGYVDQGPQAPPPPGPPMSLAPPNPGPSSGPGVVPPMRMASAPVTGNPDLPNMVDPSQLPQQGLFARTVMDPNTGGMLNDFATKRPGDDLAGLFKSLIGK